MIVCPKCGADTMVKETRPAASGLRRRRHCEDPSCNGRVTTYEIPAHKIDVRGKMRDSVVVVDATDLETMRRLAADALEGGRE